MPFRAIQKLPPDCFQVPKGPPFDSASAPTNTTRQHFNEDGQRDLGT